LTTKSSAPPVQGAHRVRLIGACRYHDDHDLDVLFTDLATQIQPVTVRQAKIQQNQIRDGLGQQPPGVRRGTRPSHLVTIRSQDAHQTGADALVILDDQNSRPRRHAQMVAQRKRP